VLHKALVEKGAEIEFVEPKPGLPDLVFTANAATVLDGKALLAVSAILSASARKPPLRLPSTDCNGMRKFTP
jgi:N-dimethylarginine dimethylaminohydrolase